MTDIQKSAICHLAIAGYSVCVKGVCSCKILKIMQIRPNFPGPIMHTINAMHLTLSVCALTTGTVVLIRLHKKADLLEMKVNGTKNGKVHADKNKL